jgi:2-dehydro-3-deoxyphosphogluconate aldolase/(4S)-4-hydroxy-2-oxoglutarate aldolase
MTREQVLARIAREWIVAVVRAETNDKARRIADALLAGGVSIIEITFTCPDPPAIIKTLAGQTRGDVLVGAGTVCTAEDVKMAHDAGAQFIVSPGLSPEVVAEAKSRNLAVMPGAATPTEVMAAARLGADIIKIFPGSLFGPSYVKALRGPFPRLRFMPTGGVALDNLKQWKDTGVVAVGVGTELVPPDAVRTNRFDVVTGRAQTFVDQIKRLG